MARRWDFISDSRVDGLLADRRSDVAGRVLDLLGNCLVALSGRSAEAVAATVGEWGGSPQATVIGSAPRLPAPSAALVNGTLAHSLDFDDTHLPSVLHPSAAVVPAALAVAEQTDASGPAFCDAMTIGVEATCRLAWDPLLEDRFGMLRAFCGERFDPEAVTCDLGERWETDRIFVKPYPCNHFTHAGVEAALRIRRRDVDPAIITELTLGVPEPVLRTIAEPIEDKRRPLSGYHGAFSGPYTVADPARFALAARVTPVADPECTRSFPHQFPAVLTVRLADGTVLEERVRHNLGGQENPLPAWELTAQFRMNARRAVDDAVAGELAALVTGLAWDIGPTAITGLLRSATIPPDSHGRPGGSRSGSALHGRCARTSGGRLHVRPGPHPGQRPVDGLLCERRLASGRPSGRCGHPRASTDISAIGQDEHHLALAAPDDAVGASRGQVAAATRQGRGQPQHLAVGSMTTCTSTPCRQCLAEWSARPLPRRSHSARVPSSRTNSGLPCAERPADRARGRPGDR